MLCQSCWNGPVGFVKPATVAIPSDETSEQVGGASKNVQNRRGPPVSTLGLALKTRRRWERPLFCPVTFQDCQKDMCNSVTPIRTKPVWPLHHFSFTSRWVRLTAHKRLK